MADMLGQAFVEVRGDLSKLPGDLSGVNKAFSGLASHFSVGTIASGLAGIATGAAAAYAPLALLSHAMSTWSELAQEGTAAAKEQAAADRRLKAALEATGHAAGVSFDELKQQADDLQSATGVADETIEQFQQRLLAFGNVQGDVFKRATHVALEWSEATGKDMTGTATLLGRALSNPVRGMQLLTRQGVMLTQNQQQLVTQFAAAGETAKAQGIILDALSKKYGDFAERSMTPMKRLKVQYDEALEKLGDEYRKREGFAMRGKTAAANFMTGFNQFMNQFVPKETGKKGILSESFWTAMGKTAAAGFAEGLSSAVAGGKGVGTAGLVGSRLNRDGVWGLREFTSGYDESDSLDAKNKAMDLKLKAKQKAQDNFAKAEKDKTQGIFDPVAFANKMQEALLTKDDKMLNALTASNHLQEQMLDELRAGNEIADEPDEVAG